MATLDPKTNRLSYGNILSPESEYTLRKAIATTYSLDLQSLVATTISLGLGEATDSELARNPLNLLYALQKVTDKILIFCDSSQIKAVASKKRNKFLGLLEKTIVPVNLMEKDSLGNYPSFHSKCWIIQYENLKDKNIRKYKFIVMSRNLTFDRSWDISVCLDGSVSASGKINQQTERIIGFVDFLQKQIGSNDPFIATKNAFINELKSDLQNVVFEANDLHFEDFEVLPIGTGAVDINDDELFKSSDARDMVVMSPFVSKNIIKRLMCRNFGYKFHPYLITRYSELDKAKDLRWDISVFCLKDRIVDSEEIVSNSDNMDFMKQDIHAKIYSLEFGDGNRFYLGSMNASENGTNRNVELLIKLYSKDYSPMMFLSDINYDKMFQRIDFSHLELLEQTDQGKDYSKILKQILRLNLSAEVEENSEGLFDVFVRFDGLDNAECKIEICPFFAEGLLTELKSETIFQNLNLGNLSEFYSIAFDGKFVQTILIPTTGMPDGREKNIVKSIITNKKKLSEYIAFILGDDSFASFTDDIIDLVEGEYDEEANKSKSKSNDNILTPVYERMLKTAFTNPERLKDVEEVINMIDDDEIVTPEFKQMYETFKTTLKF